MKAILVPDEVVTTTTFCKATMSLSDALNAEICAEGTQTRTYYSTITAYGVARFVLPHLQTAIPDIGLSCMLSSSDVYFSEKKAFSFPTIMSTVTSSQRLYSRRAAVRQGKRRAASEYECLSEEPDRKRSNIRDRTTDTEGGPAITHTQTHQRHQGDLGIRCLPLTEENLALIPYRSQEYAPVNLNSRHRSVQVTE